jgi:HK97 family phage major capsid protein
MKELIEKKNDLITRAEDVLNQAKTEKRELTEDEAAELAEIRDNVRKIIATLKLDDDFRDMEKEKMEVKEDNTPKEETEVTVEERAMQIEKQERDAFENYLRGRVIHERAGELTPATTGTGIGLGGALIPETIVNHIIRKVYDICPILERSQKFNV